LAHFMTRIAFDDFIKERRRDVNDEKHPGLVMTAYN
jgi:hypothetical protein